MAPATKTAPAETVGPGPSGVTPTSGTVLAPLSALEEPTFVAPGVFSFCPLMAGRIQGVSNRQESQRGSSKALPTPPQIPESTESLRITTCPIPVSLEILQQEQPGTERRILAFA